MKNYIKLIRVKHWLKNTLIFLPLFFSKNLYDLELLLYCLLGFICISFASSIVYVLNDIKDVEKDRLHPVKKNRPLASGVISISNAYVVIFILSLILGGLVGYLYYLVRDLLILFIPICYIFLNFLYSFWLKNVPIIDVIILVSGFLFRVMYGGVIISTSVSKFLYLMIIFGSFYLGFGKRRNEIVKNGDHSRAVLSLYNKDFLDKNMYVSLALTIVCYTLWCVDTNTILRVGHDYLFWTIPIIMVIFQLYSLDIERDSHGDPVEVIVANKVLLLLIALYIIVLFLMLYII